MILVPWAHIASWYYIIDTYAMFAAFVKKRNMTHRRIKAKLILFILDKWPFLFHHFLLTVLGYPLVVVSPTASLIITLPISKTVVTFGRSHI